MNDKGPHHFSGLNERLGYQRVDSPPINPRFASVEDVVTDLVGSREKYHTDPALYSAAKHYSGPGFRELLQGSYEHRNRFARGVEEAETVLVLTHPLYRFMSQWNEVGDHEVESAIRYLDRFFGTLGDIKEDGIQVLLIESPEHYAAGTSRLVEEGLAQDVFFTEFNNGLLLVPDQYYDLIGASRIFVGGAYADKCLKQSLSQLRGRLPRKDVVIIPELTMFYSGVVGTSTEIREEFADFVTVEVGDITDLESTALLAKIGSDAQRELFPETVAD
ncbi:MAG: hypothetical protein QF824_01075 [Candidatus Woesearchaeota archaeon]|jgi:hypothetical protein|nr:hypothetical protein [Candidatus Woesearchaeota archaeon]MDP7458057.1 hypothetical protein [Candidatus Woesearchaeota archaeon]